MGILGISALNRTLVPERSCTVDPMLPFSAIRLLWAKMLTKKPGEFLYQTAEQAGISSSYTWLQYFERTFFKGKKKLTHIRHYIIGERIKIP